MDEYWKGPYFNADYFPAPYWNGTSIIITVPSAPGGGYVPPTIIHSKLKQEDEEILMIILAIDEDY